MKNKSTISPGSRRKGIFLPVPPDRPWQGFLPLLLFVILTFSCSKKQAKNEADATEQTDVRREKIKYAKGFDIEYHDKYKVVNIFNHFEDNSGTLKYFLVPKGTQPPADVPASQIIYTPVEKLVGMSSMHVALADFAEVSEILVGLGDLKYVNSTIVRANIQSGKIQSVGLGGSMDNEMIISLKPDLVMVMGSPDAKIARYQALNQSGIPIMVNSEWLEDHPLGRAEWVKLMATLTNKEDLVNKKFEKLEKEYLRLASLTKSLKEKPKVLIGMSFKTAWHVPDGDSYMAQLLRDSGADYKWYQTKGKGNLPLDFEAVYSEGLKSDYWLNVGYVNSKNDITAKDARYADLKPFINNKIFNNNLKVNDIGSNDYWESGAVNPQIVLADLIKILHPELLPNHQLVFYKMIQ